MKEDKHFWQVQLTN